VATYTVETKGSRVDVNSLGAHIDSLWLSGKEVLMKSDDSIQTHGGCAILIPFANRVREAKYSWFGKVYQLPKNNGENSIHGFTKDMEWEISKTDKGMILSTEIKRQDYPSELKCGSRIELSEESLKIGFTFSNVGDEDVPLSVGLHPYFLHGGSWEVEEPARLRMLNYVDTFFPNGTTTDVESAFLSSKTNREFDNCFFVGSELILRINAGTIKIQTENMNYFVLYNGNYSNQKSVAVEPMTSAPDAFNNRIGLINLKKNSKFTCSSRFTFHLDS